MEEIKQFYKAEKLTDEEVYNKVESSTIADLDRAGLTYLGHNSNGGFLLSTEDIILSGLEINVREVSNTDRPPIIISSDFQEVIDIGRRRVGSLLEDNLVEVEPATAVA